MNVIHPLLPVTGDRHKYAMMMIMEENAEERGQDKLTIQTEGSDTKTGAKDSK